MELDSAHCIHIQTCPFCHMFWKVCLSMYFTPKIKRILLFTLLHLKQACTFWQHRLWARFYDVKYKCNCVPIGHTESAYRQAVCKHSSCLAVCFPDFLLSHNAFHQCNTPTMHFSCATQVLGKNQYLNHSASSSSKIMFQFWLDTPVEAVFSEFKLFFCSHKYIVAVIWSFEAL